MNSFYNPIFLSKILKNYLFTIDRLRRFNDEDLLKYQNKQFKKIVKFAYTVPLYHQKYTQAGIHPDDIQGIEDITRLPTVSKYDFIQHYPDGLISSTMNKNQLIEVTTSGTTGKSLPLYIDMMDIIIGFFGYIRALREHDINWRKDKLTIIGDFAPHTAETGYVFKGIQSQQGSTLFFKNIQWLNTNDPPEKVIEQIDTFKPDFLGGYTGMLGHLALLKEKGFGKNISPQIIASTGGVLSRPLKELIQKTFNAHVFESYASTESGPIAFQCREGNYHIMSDYVYLEFLKNGEPSTSKEAGKLVITKLFGKGTPIIRYDAINDIVAPLYEKCHCGITSGLIDKIYGRDDISLYSLDGKIILPASFGEIFSKILYELKTNMLQDVRVIQNSLTEIEIHVVIDEKQRTSGPSVDALFALLKKGFKEKLGSEVEILITEVENIDKQHPRIISKVDPSKINITGYA
jgi:phenylacetate-coenzyme A ligase PaaK-like adenylate-forming protein